MLVFSVVGWIVFTVGFVHLNKKVHKYDTTHKLFYEFIILTLVLNIMICRYYDPNTYIFPDYSKKFLGLANVLFIPMWLFIASGLAVYISLALHIIVSHQNIRHILHSIVS